ncbi:MAG: hypothetical protein A2309_01425 [Bacteroidetes bacterium RIFOXYB2_FULL_35_7]|nr:MAG: hypothetical protein A2309_01425 [Bacteroidetes bacterium RIFOXYB2_FULL_35_7]
MLQVAGAGCRLQDNRGLSGVETQVAGCTIYQIPFTILPLVLYCTIVPPVLSEVEVWNDTTGLLTTNRLLFYLPLIRKLFNFITSPYLNI